MDDLDRLDLADLLDLLADLHERDPHAVQSAMGRVTAAAFLCSEAPTLLQAP